MKTKASSILIIYCSLFFSSCASTGMIIGNNQYSGDSGSYLCVIRLTDNDNNLWSITMDNKEIARVGQNNYFLYCTSSGEHSFVTSDKEGRIIKIEMSLKKNKINYIIIEKQYNDLVIKPIDKEYAYIYSNVLTNLDKNNKDTAKKLIEDEMSKQLVESDANPRNIDEITNLYIGIKELSDNILTNIDSIKTTIANLEEQGRENTRKMNAETNSNAKLGYSIAAVVNSSAVLAWTIKLQNINKENEAAKQILHNIQKEIKNSEKIANTKKYFNSVATNVQEQAVESLDFELQKGESIYSKDTLAIIITNKNYKNDIPAVDYALNDGLAIKDLFVKSLAIKDDSIIVKNDASLSDLISIFGPMSGISNDYKKSRIYRTASLMDNPPNLIIYYSGHGAPATSGETKGNGYIVPIDADVAIIQNTGYPIDQIIKECSELTNSGIIKGSWVIMDSCFSGKTSIGQPILKNVSGLTIVPTIPSSVDRDQTLMLASSGDEYASWYQEKKHGLFTYFFIKGLSGDSDINCDSRIQLSEFKKYLEKNIPKYSNGLNAQTQAPQIIFNDDIEIVKY